MKSAVESCLLTVLWNSCFYYFDLPTVFSFSVLPIGYLVSLFGLGVCFPFLKLCQEWYFLGLQMNI